MHTLDTPAIWRALLNGIYRQAAHHAKEALPILDSLLAATFRFAEMETWPQATKGRTGTVGLQIRFTHRGRRLKLRWDHDARAIHLVEVLGQTEGPVLARFAATDRPQAIHYTMYAALRDLGHAAA